MKWLSKGLKDKVIKINKQHNEVTYLPYNKTRSLNNPEEKVQLATYLKVIYELKYPASHVRVCVPVKMGSSTKEADIIAYNDDKGLEPNIIIECKKKGISSRVFKEAIHQGFSYAAALLGKFVWTTDGEHNSYHEVIPDRIGERTKNELPILPEFKSEKSFFFNCRKWFFRNTKSFFQVIGRSIKQPLFIHSFIHVFFFFLVFLGCSKLLFINIHDILNIPLVQQSWYSLKMDFSWFYMLLSFISLLIVISLSNIVSFIPSLGKSRLSFKQKVFISFFMCIPIWITVKLYTKSWWNWEHFTKLIDNKSWMFIQPHLLILPIQFLIIASILSLPKNGKRKKKK